MPALSPTAPSTSDDAPPHRASRRLAAALAALVVLTVFYVASYGDAMGTFFSFDDYWVMARAHDLGIRSPLDVWRFFTLDHNGFVMYRPLYASYYWLLHALFGYDPAGYHAFHLLLNVLNAFVVYGVATFALGSAPRGLATALLYATAPGHAIAVYWVALWTVVGPTFWYLLTLYVWLRGHARPAVIPLYLVALACAEHAITLPLTLTLAVVLLEGRWPSRADLRVLVPLYAIMVAYLGAKVWYLRVSPLAQLLLGIGYGMSADPVVWLENLGRYAGYASALLYPVVSPGTAASHPTAIAVGALVVGLAGALAIACLPGRRATPALRAAAFGLAGFPVMLGPVLVLGGHLYGYYVSTAACGMALAAIGTTSALPRVGRWAPFACLTVALVVYAGDARRAIERESELGFYRNYSRSAARWLYTVDTLDHERPDLQQLIVPYDFVTSLIFETGAHELLLPGVRLKVRLSRNPSLHAAEPGTIVVDEPYVRPPGVRLPGARPAWNWLRRAPAD